MSDINLLLEVVFSIMRFLFFRSLKYSLNLEEEMFVFLKSGVGFILFLFL